MSITTALATVALLSATSTLGYHYYTKNNTPSNTNVPAMEVTQSLPDANGVACYSTMWYGHFGFTCLKVR